MSQIQGLAAHAAGAELLPFRYDAGEVGAQEVEIAISHCGICHSDIHLISNDWGISQYPFIPGHEVIGTVAAAGSGVRTLKVGQRVGLGWQSNSCGECAWCMQGLENLCALSEATCVRRHGGYAERVRANARFVVPIPEGLPSEQAAPLLCGGVTVYSPLRTHGVNPSSRVGVVGIGGLGHLAIQFARAFGCEVTAFSSSAEKEDEARELGAHNFVNSRETESDARCGRNAGLHYDDGECRPGLGDLCAGAAADGNLVLPRRAAIAGFDRRLPSDRGDAVDHRQPDRESLLPAGDAGRRGAAWRAGEDGALRDGQGE